MDLTLMVAGISAVAAAGAFLVSYLSYRRDRRRVKILSSGNQNDLQLTIFNRGRRPVVIGEIGVHWLAFKLRPSKAAFRDYVFGSDQPQLPTLLGEGEILVWTIPWPDLAEQFAKFSEMGASYLGEVIGFDGRGGHPVVYVQTTDKRYYVSLEELGLPARSIFDEMVRDERQKLQSVGWADDLGPGDGE